MHELGIAASVLDAVQAEAQRHPGMRLNCVGLRIGELAAVDPDALSFAFEALTRQTEFESLALEIEMCPRRHRCGSCATVFEARDFVFACPRCGASRTQCIGGDELEIAYLEVDDEPRSARTQSA